MLNFHRHLSQIQLPDKWIQKKGAPVAGRPLGMGFSRMSQLAVASTTLVSSISSVPKGRLIFRCLYWGRPVPAGIR
jgi:hypothetical protein